MKGAHRRLGNRVGSISHLKRHSPGAVAAITALFLNTLEAAAAAVIDTPIVLIVSPHWHTV